MSNTKKALRYFAKYLKPYWKRITIVVVLSLISSGAQVMAPTYLGRSVTALTTYLADLKKGTASLDTFYQALWSMFLFYLLSQVAIFIAWMASFCYQILLSDKVHKSYLSLQTLQ